MSDETIPQTTSTPQHETRTEKLEEVASTVVGAAVGELTGGPAGAVRGALEILAHIAEHGHGPGQTAPLQPSDYDNAFAKTLASSIRKDDQRAMFAAAALAGLIAASGRTAFDAGQHQQFADQAKGFAEAMELALT